MTRLGGKTIPSVHFGKVTSCKKACVCERYEFGPAEGQDFGRTSGQRGRTEQCHVVKKMNVTHLYLSKCLLLEQ